MSGELASPPAEVHPSTLNGWIASPWHTRLRAELGPDCSTVGRAPAAIGVVASSFNFRIIGDGEDVLCRDPNTATGWVPLTVGVLRSWAFDGMQSAYRPTEDEWPAVVDGVRARVLSDWRKAMASLPDEAARAAALLEQERRRELDALDAEAAALEARRVRLINRT